MRIEGHAELVTGGASGLGEATARLGAKVAVLDVNMELAEKIAADIGGIAWPTMRSVMRRSVVRQV